MPGPISALQGGWGLRALPIPADRVTHPTNPWNPFVYVTEAMAGFFVLDLVNHLRVVETEELPPSL